ncbi:AraC-like DNA-binding protein [Pedobacter cryoconitis]|uniref:AraC-like DNA-binding protein n=1 Tax=Pedobacter cryoconitis TaxID=188932 RepID=A0A7W8ZPL6_9SPHI|nr:AraC family transcriptional regulator [Pedobacter cryoconitis]MBB5637607.1 AraC-like DNA-binding protein [Pedobacter cryoconitis]MBB6270034.1 AraC-like DNA-binding protein [Pedobacter cryoconitis]
MKSQQIDIIKFPISPLAKAGVLIKNMEDNSHAAEHDHSRPHRDDHYLLMIATSGHFVINIDFENNIITAPAMVLIFPGQIHHIVSAREPSGWGISIDQALIDKEFQIIMERGFHHSLSLDRQSAFYNHTVTLMGEMEKLQTTAANLYAVRATHSILDAFLGLLAGEIAAVNNHGKTKSNRGAIIEQSFMQLLKIHYKDWKQPARYASELNISVAHLYDTIKTITGDSVSVYIQQYCMLEAKRLLCFTKFTVKEIGYQLGYEEPVYFGKLFKKVTGLTPLQFRRQYLD